MNPWVACKTRRCPATLCLKTSGKLVAKRLLQFPLPRIARVFARRISRSNSETAKQLDQQLWQVKESLHRSVALGAESAIRGEFAGVYLECSEADWDGYNALAVDPDSFALAKAYFMALPLGSRSPSAGAHPDVQMSLEWSSAPRRSLTISFDPVGDLHFAALAGPSRARGTEVFDGEIPQIILELLERVS